MNGNLYATVADEVQFGPAYRCWICGEPVGRLVPFHEWVPGPTALDRYAEHLAYLDLHPGCRSRSHPARVVRVGPAITPVDWPKHTPVEERFGAIERAITLLAEALQDKRVQVDHVEGLDDALALALRIHQGALAPAQGAAEIRALAGTGAVFAAT
jgi:hypothetical protein